MNKDKDTFPTIPEDLAIDFKHASKRQKQQIREILIYNYTKMVDEFVAKADYATTTGYWKDFIPLTKKITKAKDFIKKYGKKKKIAGRIYDYEIIYEFGDGTKNDIIHGKNWANAKANFEKKYGSWKIIKHKRLGNQTKRS